MSGQEQQKQVQLLIFDTETTGLPRGPRGTSVFENPLNWPDIVSICWTVYHGSKFFKREYHIIRPAGWDIPAESVKFHGITQDMALTKGEPLADVLAVLKKDIQESTRIIAHNLDFDKNVLFHAFYWRLSEDPRLFWPTPAEFCSLRQSMGELKIPGKYPSKQDPYKMPSLDELYVATFDEPAPPNAHSADRDVMVLEQILLTRWPQLFRSPYAYKS